MTLRVTISRCTAHDDEREERRVLPPLAPELPFGEVRRAAKRALFEAGYYRRQLEHADFPGIAVLCYHSVRGPETDVPFAELHVTSETFARHCKLISESCNPMSLADLRAARAGTLRLPPRPVIVTFDDGYLGVLEHALPSLERYGVPAAVFVATDAVVSRQHFWFDVLHRRDGEDAVLNAKRSTFRRWSAIRESLHQDADPNETHRPMDVHELERLAASPLVEIGGHTKTHPTLALEPSDEQRCEIEDCRRTLQEILRRPINAFAYPYGSLRQDYSAETAGIVRETGFDLGFTTTASFASLEGNPYEIPRFVMLDSVSDAELAHRLLYSWHVPGVSR